MQTIADGAEGTFTYIESDDTVIDAFGGAIGAQQGVSLKNIRLEILGLEGVTIENSFAGSYNLTATADKKQVKVIYADMYQGEFRDVLVKLNVPAISTDEPLISAVATFDYRLSIGVDIRTACVSNQCSVCRIFPGEIDPTMEGDVEVDIQINRMETTAAIKSALRLADVGEFAQAKALIEMRIQDFKKTVSFRQGGTLVESMLQDLRDTLGSVSDRNEYMHHGGRGASAEILGTMSKQRSIYTKTGKAATYQTARSSATQSLACSSKTSNK